MLLLLLLPLELWSANIWPLSNERVCETIIKTETYLVNEKIRVLYYEEWEKKKREIFFFFFSFERFLVMDLEPKDYKSGAAMWERTKKVRASLLQYLTGQSLRELWFWFIVWKEEKCLRISEVDSIFSFFFFFSQIKRKLKMKFE